MESLEKKFEPVINLYLSVASFCDARALQDITQNVQLIETK